MKRQTTINCDVFCFGDLILPNEDILITGNLYVEGSVSVRDIETGEDINIISASSVKAHSIFSHGNISISTVDLNVLLFGSEQNCNISFLQNIVPKKGNNNSTGNCSNCLLGGKCSVCPCFFCEKMNIEVCQKCMDNPCTVLKKCPNSEKKDILDDYNVDYDKSYDETYYNS